MISSRFSSIASVLTLVGTMMAHAPEASAHVSEHYAHTYNLDLYSDFIMHMRLPNATTGCCGGDDAVPNVAAKPHDDGSYTLTVPAGTFGIPKDLTFDIPKERVLSGDQAYKLCREHPEWTTCTPPEFTILWVSPSNLRTGQPNIYCFWDPPSSTENKHGPQIRYGFNDKALTDEKKVSLDEAIKLISFSRATWEKSHGLKQPTVMQVPAVWH